MTTKQRQHLLAFLGYYVSNVDGEWGALSKTACTAFQKDFGGIKVDGFGGTETDKALKHAVAYGMPAKEDTSTKEENATGNFWDGIKYFKRSEFACKCGKYCNGFPVEPNEKLVETLETIREHFGVPVTVSSGIRCKTHNTNVGGVSKSQHMEGTAADIVVKGVPVSEVVKYAETLMPKTGGIGTYKTFTHIDVRSVKARWNG